MAARRGTNYVSSGSLPLPSPIGHARGRRRLRALLLVLALLLLALGAVLAWRWDAFSDRGWQPLGWSNGFVVTDDSRFLVRWSPRQGGGTYVSLLELDNPLDRWLGPRARFELPDDWALESFAAGDRIVLARADATRSPARLTLSVGAAPSAVVEGRAIPLVVSTRADLELARGKTLTARRPSAPGTVLWQASVAWFDTPAISPDGSRVALASQTNVDLRDGRTGSRVALLAWPGRPTDPRATTWCAFDGAGQLLAWRSPASTRAVNRWRADDGAPLASLPLGGTELVWDVATEAPRCLSRGGGRWIVRDTLNGATLVDAPDIAPHAGLTPDGAKLLCVSDGGHVRVVRVP